MTDANNTEPGDVDDARGKLSEGQSYYGQTIDSHRGNGETLGKHRGQWRNNGQT